MTAVVFLANPHYLGAHRAPLQDFCRSLFVSFHHGGQAHCPPFLLDTRLQSELLAGIGTVESDLRRRRGLGENFRHHLVDREAVELFFAPNDEPMRQNILRDGFDLFHRDGAAAIDRRHRLCGAE